MRLQPELELLGKNAVASRDEELLNLCSIENSGPKNCGGGLRGPNDSEEKTLKSHQNSGWFFLVKNVF